ncbi:MYND finger [Ancylostoma duodenale]|uniref:MYND finger n=1 Tax=Ancylostoma duodenale TaxID=51022 RepID=A0A0C2H9L1_9BILA|nr:MYND finger [Ancylostoma duodenale]
MLEKCRYCGCADAKSLKQCLFCGSVAYCSDEHQQFDWKRHKPVCKQTQTEMQRRLAAASAGPSSCTTYTQTDRICSTSTPSPDPSPPCSESSAFAAASPSPRPSTSATPSEERLIPTDDPDIQVGSLLVVLDILATNLLCKNNKLAMS